MPAHCERNVGALSLEKKPAALVRRSPLPLVDSGYPIENFIPPRPPKSFRVTLDLAQSSKRLDTVLLTALKDQKENLNLQNISRAKFKALFNDGKILIKGQRATPTSGLARGVTYIDILGF